MSNTFDKLSVLDSFIEEVNSYLPEIETNLERLAHSSSDMDAIEETYRRTHTIGGSASMMDFPGLAHVAHGMEDILGDVLDGISSMDASTLGLLQRSLARMHKLLQGIHDGIDEEAIMAEDDADYVRYRANLDSSPQVTTNGNVHNANNVHYEQVSSASLPSFSDLGGIPATADSSLPSFDEVLASFRTPSLASDDHSAWPEETITVEPEITNTAHQAEQVQQIPISYPEEQQAEPFQPETSLVSESERELASLSAWEMLVATTAAHPVPPVSPTPTPPETEYTVEPALSQHNPADAASLATPSAFEDEGALYSDSDLDGGSATDPKRSALVTPSAPVTPILPITPVELTLPTAFDEMHAETRSIAAQASSLKQLLQQLRMTMTVIEAQRTEFKGFLDGSRDALDRMEVWAGEAMGLNLRNSPDQVRRYLPLSVMWVSNTKLKKVLDLLKQITSGVELTDEQIDSALQQLSSSIASCGDAFQQLQAQNSSHLFTHDQGWTPWEMSVSREAEAMRERVTFERRGDPASLRAEIEASVREEYRREQEAKIREELRREYEARPLTLAARSELERQLRSEIRQEFEAKRQLQERVSGPGDAESLQELEERLRSEIEIQVRQDFLNQITDGAGGILHQSMQQTLLPPVPSAPRTSNFADQARLATGLPTVNTQIPTRETQRDTFTQPSNMSTPLPSAQPQLSQSAQPFPQSVAPKALTSTSNIAADFGEEATEIFRLEAEEHLQNIIMHVAALEKSPTNRELIQGIRRATHTLKGAAAMMGFRAIADLSHISEDLLESIMEGTVTITPDVLSLILDTAETLDLLVTGKGSDLQNEEAKVQSLRVRYVNLLGEQSILADVDLEDADADELNEPVLTNEDSSVTGVVSGTQTLETNVQRAARGDLSVRVRLQKLDELVNLFGEQLVNRSILEERVNRLVQLVSEVGISSNRLRDVGQKLESRFEAATLPSGHSVQVMPGEGLQSKLSRNGNKNRTEPEHLADFDELELDRYTEFHQLARGLSEGISDMATLSTEMDAVMRDCESVFSRENRLNTTFQDRLMKARLVPLSTMTPRLYRAARAVALKQHKEFEFLLEGENTEVDRTVNEEIAGPLLHLMRNAVNHAIETPEVRVQKGKPPAGQIKLSAVYEGNQVAITVRDDGAGIDPERVRKAAIARGFIQENQILTDSDIIDLIFRPGFSTAEVLSEESGRGVGLDVVRDSVSRLRGTLVVESMPGQGTAFTMKFPTSLAIQSAMMVMAGERQFAIPTVLVEAIGRLDNFKHSTLAGRPAVLVQNELYPLNTLAQLLALPQSPMNDRAPVLLVNAGGNRVALVVDEIKGKLDVVMKNLGPHLRNVHGIAGGTIMGNGRVVLILELIELLSTRSKLFASAPATTSFAATHRDSKVVPALQSGSTMASMNTVVISGQQSTPAISKPPTAPVPSQAEHGKHVLIVDDSPSVRRVVSNMLKQHGWEVQMARDGVEALEMISRQTPAAVLLDIEMPRMDGYELISTIRAQEQYRTLPLVILTSRAAAKHQQRATQLGANSYVIKPYQDEELINILNTLIYGATAR